MLHREACCTICVLAYHPSTLQCPIAAVLPVCLASSVPENREVCLVLAVHTAVFAGPAFQVHKAVLQVQEETK
jgi:hypothetical protein